MSNELVLNAENYGIEKSKAEQIEAVFVPMVKMLKSFESVYNEVIEESENGINTEIVSKAKRVRLDIKRVRIDTEKTRKAQKEEYLRAGKAIDGVANILKFAVVEKEDKLKTIEKHFERIEEERLQKIHDDREAELLKYTDETDGLDLSKMPDHVWEKYIEGYRLAHEKQIEAEKKAEAARIQAEKEEAEERKRIEEENKKLKAEADERERLAKIEAEKQEKEKAALEKKLEKERAEREKAEKIEAEKRAKEAEEREKREAAEREKQEKKLQAEREAKEKAEKELAEKKAAEVKIQAEKEAKEKAMRLAPDKEKLLQLASTIQDIEIPIVKNKEAQPIIDQVRKRLETTYHDLIELANKL